MEQEFLSTSQVAKILGVSRITIFNKIKTKKIQAVKIGRNFVIEKSELLKALGTLLNESKKKEIEEIVNKTADEYGETLRWLGRE